MRNSRRYAAVGVCLVAMALAGGCEKKRQASIGTGGVTGVYYPTGGAIAKLVGSGGDLTLTVQTTGGSVFNINAVVAGELDFGIAQADRQHQAVQGLAEWADKGPQGKLRSVCSLYPEMVTLVAADDAGIRSLSDLKGKSVNIGNPGSGQRGNALDVFRAVGIDPETDLSAEGLKASESASMLQDGRIDAFFYTVGHPNGAIKEATAGQRRKVRFVPIEEVGTLLSDSPYYAPAEIPIEYYPKAVNDADVPTLGVMTTLVTSADVPEEIVYDVTKAIFSNLETLRGQHPALAGLQREKMLLGLSAPIHPGAARYFDEVGLDRP